MTTERKIGLHPVPTAAPQRFPNIRKWLSETAPKPPKAPKAPKSPVPPYLTDFLRDSRAAVSKPPWEPWKTSVVLPLPDGTQRPPPPQKDGDSFLENVFEMFDATGMSSYNDVGRAWEKWKTTWPDQKLFWGAPANPFNDAGLSMLWEAIGAIPGFGKAPKLGSRFIDRKWVPPTPDQINKAKIQDAWYKTEPWVRRTQAVTDIKEDNLSK